jgi:hypothetical protein
MPLLGCAEIHEHEPTIVPPTMVIRQSLHSIKPNQCLNALEQVVAESKSFPFKN